MKKIIEYAKLLAFFIVVGLTYFSLPLILLAWANYPALSQLWLLLVIVWVLFLFHAMNSTNREPHNK